MVDLKRKALENIRNFVKNTPREEILQKLGDISNKSVEGYFIKDILGAEFISLFCDGIKLKELTSVDIPPNSNDNYEYQINLIKTRKKASFFI